jgi:hypothetical protein
MDVLFEVALGIGIVCVLVCMVVIHKATKQVSEPRPINVMPPAYLMKKAQSGVPPAPRPRPPAPAVRQRKPKNPDLTRVQCKCGKQVALTKTGKLYTHNKPGERYYNCSYSGSKPYAYIIHEDPI